MLDRGIEIAQQYGFIEIVRDRFGPDLIKNAGQNWDAWRDATTTLGGPFVNFGLAGESSDEWLRSALQSVNDTFDELQIADSDFDRADHEWEPIPLDRSDEHLIAATEAIEKVAEDLRMDNGYGVTHPEEKRYVLDSLRNVARTLREDTHISWMYLKEFALKPIAVLLKRFGDAAVGISAAAARDALSAWLKNKGVAFLDSLFR